MYKKINFYFLFYIFLFLWNVTNLITGYTFFVNNFPPLLYVRYVILFTVRVFCVMKIAYDMSKVGFIRTLLLIMLILFFEWNAKYTGINIFVYMAYFVFSSYGVSIQKSFKVLFYSVVFTLVLTVFAYLIGIIRSNDILTSSGIIKYSLGFSNPNTFGLLLAYAALTAYLCNFKKLFVLSLSLICFLGCYFISYSRTSIFIVAVVFGLQLIDKFINKQSVSKTRLLSLSSKAVLLISFVSSLIIASDLFDLSKYDHLFSGRIHLYHGFFTNFKVNLFGHALFRNSFSMSEYGLSTLDNSYLLVLLGSGLIALILFLFGALYTLNYLEKKGDSKKIILFSFLAIIGIFETFFVRLEFNPMLLLFGCALFDTIKVKRINEFRRPQLISQ